MPDVKILYIKGKECKNINDIIVSIDDGTGYKKILLGDIFTEGVCKKNGKLTYRQANIIWWKANQIMLNQRIT